MGKGGRRRGQQSCHSIASVTGVLEKNNEIMTIATAREVSTFIAVT